ncbi:MAG: NDP-sugar synthase [Methyloligellaceae bacterium]
MPDNRVVVLAGGKGTRLRPFTASFPKPLVPIGDKPILDILLSQFAQQNFAQITLSLGHLAELIKAYIVQHKSLRDRLKIDFVEEETPTGTAGSLAMISGLNDTFLVVNGDVLTDLDYNALLTSHKASGAALTIATHQKDLKIDFGILEAGENAIVNGYIEKPNKSYEVSMGVYVYEPRVLEFIHPGKYLDLPDLVHLLMAKGEQVGVYRNDAFWLDIGRPDDYALAQELYEADALKFGG